MTQPLPSPLRDYLSYTLEQYRGKGTFRDDRARFAEAATAAQEALLLQPALQAAAAVQNVKSSFGKGGWALCPWMAILDSRETRTTQSGVYIAWLFRADMSGVYLTLAQGVTEVKKVHKGDSFDVLRAEAEKVRDVTGSLGEQGFSSDPISLGLSASAEAYEASMILQKFYPSDALPSERELLDDVDVLFRVYGTYLGQKALPSANQALILPSITQDLQQAFHGRGLTYTDEQVEMFFTALQTKGFVIVSGISGTGKSKIAQAFADLCQTDTPSTQKYPETLRKRVTPSDLQHDRSLTIPKAHWAEFGLQSIFAPDRVLVTLNGVTSDCRLARTNPNQLEVKLSGTVWEEFRRQFQEGDGYWLLPTRPADVQDPTRPLEVQLTPDLLGSSPGASRVLFLPVKPDWRDNKSLLGYYNPLSETYLRPAFLELLDAALSDYEQRGAQAAPWFVILDEMNLAHVEHYFSDVLSVLESGRDAQGLTLEAVVLDAPPEVVLTRRRFPLPPNLYLVGTVNLDETTHVFSPKVLDRAFSLEFTEVDFTHYPPQVSTDTTALHAHTLQAFTSDGQFAQIHKAGVTAALLQHPELRAALQALTSMLRPHLLHFGYRVFDEIALFHAHAQRSGMLSEPGAALDAAVSMKVLPKFHGGRAKLWAALVKVLCWSADPHQPQLALEQLNGVLAGRTLEDASLHDLRPILLDEPQAPLTSARALRMLEDLERDGFTAFG